jgi:hypothetical protein
MIVGVLRLGVRELVAIDLFVGLPFASLADEIINTR